MADLHAIYQELGLSGLVPHATRETSKARTMLINKIKAGESLFFLSSPVTNAPFLMVMDHARQALMFTTEEAAQKHAEKLRHEQCMETEIYVFPGSHSTEDAAISFYNFGVDALYIDQSITLSISLFMRRPSYDGYPNEEFLLRNHHMNGALHYYMQIAQAQMSNHVAEYSFAGNLCNGHLLLPVTENKSDSEDLIDVITLSDGEGNEPFIIAFTDWQQCEMAEASTSAVVVSFAELADHLLNNNINLLLNPAGVSMVLRPHYVEYLLNVASAPSAAHIPLVNSLTRSFHEQDGEEEWELQDPTPDFLR